MKKFTLPLFKTSSYCEVTWSDKYNIIIFWGNKISFESKSVFNSNIIT